MLSVYERRLDRFKNSRDSAEQDMYLAVKWLENEGKDLFKDKVFPPAILSLGMKDKSYRAIIDGAFRKLDLYVSSWCLLHPNLQVFTCLSREDYKTFCHWTQDNKANFFDHSLNVRVVENSGGNQFNDWRPPCPSNQLKSLGFDCWLKDLLTGPEEVINTLCHSNQVHATVYILPLSRLN
jgi:structural maintenance of chromosomes protein 5